MALSDKDFSKFKFGLALKKFMDRSNELKPNAKAGNVKEPKPFESISFRELETASGIPHPSIVQIVNGKKNPSWSTITLLLDGLEIRLSQFAAVYEEIGDKEVYAYYEEITAKNQERISKKKLQGKKAAQGSKKSLKK